MVFGQFYGGNITWKAATGLNIYIIEYVICAVAAKGVYQNAG